MYGKGILPLDSPMVTERPDGVRAMKSLIKRLEAMSTFHQELAAAVKKALEAGATTSDVKTALSNLSEMIEEEEE